MSLKWHKDEHGVLHAGNGRFWISRYKRGLYGVLDMKTLGTVMCTTLADAKKTADGWFTLQRPTTRPRRGTSPGSPR